MNLLEVPMLLLLLACGSLTKISEPAEEYVIVDRW